MIVKITEQNEKCFCREVGNVLVSEDKDIHLIVEHNNDPNSFVVFDLEKNVIRFYDSFEDFDEDFPTYKEYYPSEMTLHLEE